MNDKNKSNNNYETVGDDDVLLFEEATFMVRRFKKLAASKFIPIHYEDTLNEADVFLVGTISLALY